MAAPFEHSPANRPARSRSRTSSPNPAQTTDLITSRDNRWLKQFRAALGGKDSGDVVGIEGARLVEDALGSGTEIVAILSSESGERHLSRLADLIPTETPVLHTTDSLFGQLAGTETPQGIAALIKPPAATFDDLVSGVPLLLVLAGVQDPGNVGVLVRTAEAFGATGVAACSAGGIGTSNPFGPKALRASAGSALRLPVLRCASAPVFMAQLRVAGVRVYAACPPPRPSVSTDESAAQPARQPERQPLAPWEADWKSPVALLVGNEGAGLPPEIARSADEILRIPQAVSAYSGQPLDSLNASVAGAVLLYEAARQRGLR
jgi:TrmH family RNA methyltransferase